MANVTYLLGAGASANCLPIINNFSERLIIVKRILKNLSESKSDTIILSGTPVKSYPPALKNYTTAKVIIEDFKWIIEEVSHHQTIDTLAKRYFHTDLNSLLRLKRLLIFFFLFEQKIGNTISEYIPREEKIKKNIIEKRYDSFIASIIANTPNEVELSGNVKVLSWNYDCQFELNLKKYNNSSWQNLKSKYQIFPNISLGKDLNQILDKAKFAFIKLNGSAEYDPFLLFRKTEKVNYLEVEMNSEINLIDELLEYYDHSIDNENIENSHLSYFNYSWESVPEYKHKNTQYDTTIQNAIEIAKQTDILVIIGYSFPFFNREIDRVLINSMNKLQKVYVQDYNSENLVNQIQNSFDLLKPKIAATDYKDGAFETRKLKIPIEAIKSVNAFFLPPEL